MLKVVLCCSLLANVVLSLLFVSEPGRREPPLPLLEPGAAASARPLGRRERTASSAPTASAASSASTSSAASSASTESTAGAAYYQRLLAAGLTEAEAKTLVHASLEREERARVGAPEDTYWISGAEARLEHALAELDADARVRSRLLSIFGRQAEGDAVFARLFRPLDPHFPFLTSSEQLGVLRFRLERQLQGAALFEAGQAALPGPSMPPPGLPGRSTLPSSAAPPAGAVRDVAEVLSGDALFEYELRESPLAIRLRSANAGLSEQEFRRAFSILKEIDQADGDIRDHLDARAALARLLGPRGFARLWSTVDPVFGAVGRVAEQHGLSRDATLDAYGLLARYEEQLLAALDAFGGDAAGLATHVGELSADLERQLAGLVGDAAATALLGARATSRFLAVSGPSESPRGNEIE